MASGPKIGIVTVSYHSETQIGALLQSLKDGVLHA